jgi:hypothetical protein
MSDELVERLRAVEFVTMPGQPMTLASAMPWLKANDALRKEAADRIEADARRIAELEGLVKEAEPFALVSIEGVIKQAEGQVTITTCAEYFHRIASTYALLARMGGSDGSA